MTDTQTAQTNESEYEFSYRRKKSKKGVISHLWTIVGPRGGVHLWANLYQGRDAYDVYGTSSKWCGGFELHSPVPFYQDDDEPPVKPTDESCWLIKGKCYHDGSSSDFDNYIADDLGTDNFITEKIHEIVNKELVRVYDRRLPKDTCGQQL
jgi:hypothetical protein